MAKIPNPAVPQVTVVTVSDGASTSKAIQDATGRIITESQVSQIRAGQQVELDKVTALRDQLIGGETSAIDLIINQARDEFQRRVALLDLQKADLNSQLQKLKEGDVSLRQEIIEKMINRLAARVDLMTGSRDRSDQLLSQIQSAVAGDLAPALVVPSVPAPAVELGAADVKAASG
jgi:dihydroxyacetone kinase DhaKLM complex PTS-EIIA-like component DhaM